MLHIRHSNRFKKDIKLTKRRCKDMMKIQKVIDLLAQQNTPALLDQYKDHPLHGRYYKRRECHVEPNWLLIYRIENDTLVLERTGSHADLFK